MESLSETKIQTVKLPLKQKHSGTSLRKDHDGIPFKEKKHNKH